MSKFTNSIRGNIMPRNPRPKPRNWNLDNMREEPKNSSRQPEIVQFGNGAYAIRKLDVQGRAEYADLEHIQNVGKYWWDKRSKYYKNCVTTDLEYIQNTLNVVLQYEIDKVKAKIADADMGKPIAICDVAPPAVPEPRVTPMQAVGKAIFKKLKFSFTD